MKRYSLRTLMLYVALVCVVLAPIAMLGRAIRSVFLAEEHLQAMYRAIAATQRFVERNPGEWPGSWKQLKGDIPPEIDSDWVAENVEYDFSANPAELAEQSWDTFTGIRPLEPCFGNYEFMLTHLISTLQDQHRPSGE